MGVRYSDVRLIVDRPIPNPRYLTVLYEDKKNMRFQLEGERVVSEVILSPETIFNLWVDLGDWLKTRPKPMHGRDIVAIEQGKPVPPQVIISRHQIPRIIPDYKTPLTEIPEFTKKKAWWHFW